MATTVGRYYFWMGLIPLLWGCGSSVDCAIRGDNIKGHVLFTPAVQPTAGTSIVIQYSTDGFSTVAGTQVIHNTQGLVSIPYSYCADRGAASVFRAFQDDNANSSWDTLEGNGRHDGTEDGHAEATVHTIAAPSPEASPGLDWEVVEGVDIFLDQRETQ